MQRKLAQTSFLLLLVIITLLFGWILQPFFGAILWAVVIAIVFYPLQLKWAPRFGRHRNLLALTVLLVCTVAVILPVLTIVFSLLQRATSLYQKVQAGELDLGVYFDQLKNGFPRVQALAGHVGINVDNLGEHFSAAAMQASKYLTTQAFTFGQGTAQFLVSFSLTLYLAFFFLRDGDFLVSTLVRALPLGDQIERTLLRKIAEVTSATVKGNLAVAAVQGALGGLIFWILGIEGALLWAVVMTFASLLPALGPALVWGPAAIYLLAIHDIWQGVVLIGFGAGVIGTIDNFLRPILVGRSTQIPDYLVLFSTLGGIAVFGLNGFVLGPLIAGVFIVFWDIFIREFNP